MSIHINWRKASAKWGKAVAEHPDTSSAVLTELAFHEDVEVLTAVADHKKTTVETLKYLAQNENVDLRYSIAENHNNHLDVLNMLVADGNPFVAHRARKTLDRVLGTSVLPAPVKLLRIIPPQSDAS